ncbi:MAG: hypothetical protein DRJ13_16290 [Bacteroidetes bacterium]|nr:MAG: hypothetical protein DRJ13_16290 [Bacteroidota bacterium]
MPGPGSIYSLHIHLVFVIKYRKKVFTEKMYERLYFHFERDSTRWRALHKNDQSFRSAA